MIKYNYYSNWLLYIFYFIDLIGHHINDNAIQINIYISI